MQTIETNIMKTELTDNELIAEFMGWEHCNSPTCLEANNLCWSKDGHGYIPKNDLKFDESWEWFMPVVTKMFDLWVPASHGFQKALNLKLDQFKRDTPIFIHIQQANKNLIKVFKVVQRK
jgi:hypothetical protein